MAVIVIVMAVIVVVVVVVPMIHKLDLAILGPLEPQQQGGGNTTPHHRQHPDGGAGLLLQAARQGSNLLGAEAIGPAEQHQVGRRQLITEQVLDVAEVIEAGVSQALGLERCRITDHAAGGESLSIHHRDHPADAGAATDLRPAEGLHQRQRQRQAAGLHHDAVELIGALEQCLHGRQKFVLDGAAKAAVGQLDHPTIKLLLWAEAAAADQVAIDADLTELIDQNGQPETAVEQQAAQQGRLTGTEEAGHHSDRQAPRRSGDHLRQPGLSRRRHRRYRSAGRRRGGGGQGYSAQPRPAPGSATTAAGHPG